MQIGSSHISSQGISSFGGVRRHGGHGEDEAIERHPQVGHAGKDATDVSLSPEARRAMEGAALGIAAAEEPEAPEEVEEKAEAAETEEAAEGPGELTEQEEQEVAELKARDAEVRAHEQAHVAAAGGHTSGGIKYEFQRGPDNQQYAVGGHVSIDTAPVQGDPARTIQKAETVRRAALAPAEPSAADKQVAAKASRTATQARIELATEQQEELAEAKEEADAERDEHADQEGARPTVHASHALASYAMAA